jgi:uncharacterized protein YuzE
MRRRGISSAEVVKMITHPGQVLESTMKVIYDQETDTLSIILRPGKVAESDEVADGLILDYNSTGKLLSIELLDASEKVKGPDSVEFALAAQK